LDEVLERERFVEGVCIRGLFYVFKKVFLELKKNTFLVENIFLVGN
jgi:hypothetical protein